jgi:hypothetical protein
MRYFDPLRTLDKTSTLRQLLRGQQSFIPFGSVGKSSDIAGGGVVDLAPLDAM